MPTLMRWSLGLAIAALVTVAPIVHYRAVYTNGKRLRVVTPDQMYRSGQLTVAGFKDAVERHGIRTIVNLQDDFPNPDIEKSFLDRATIKETDMCRQLGVKYVLIAPDLIPPHDPQGRRPEAIDQFLTVLKDKKTYPRPLLVHCHAGLHRTGVMVALYRMAEEGWSPQEAIREMKANGFGEWGCTSANEYVTQYVLTYPRSQGSGIRGQDPGHRGLGAGLGSEEAGIDDQ